jgi:hypothetical protein
VVVRLSQDLLLSKKSRWCYFTCLCKLKDYIYVSILWIGTEINQFVVRIAVGVIL